MAGAFLCLSDGVGPHCSRPIVQPVMRPAHGEVVQCFCASEGGTGEPSNVWYMRLIKDWDLRAETGSRDEHLREIIYRKGNQKNK